ncbi:MAG: hypothetical protein IT475_01805 [Aquimonas sp.]|jgi:hypothetical protein|nr:hypothetical protein [Xanthomonadales bacterium]MCC6504161.1 hypothetical protein [Aquimonas sp.]
MEDQAWNALVDFDATGKTTCELRRRTKKGQETRQGKGKDTETALAAALRLPGATFASRQDDEAAAIAAYRRRVFQVETHANLMRISDAH